MSGGFYQRYEPPVSKPGAQNTTKTVKSNNPPSGSIQPQPFFNRYVPLAKPVQTSENVDPNTQMRASKRQKQHDTLPHREKGVLADSSAAVNANASSQSNQFSEDDESSEDGDTSESDESSEGFGKHKRMKEKYQKAQKLSGKRKRQIATKADAVGEKPGIEKPSKKIEQHGLEPLPQPLIREEPAIAQKTPLPDWLANPVRAKGREIELSNLSIGVPTLQNVLKRGFSKAFAVQSAVIPMLLKGDKSRHFGDVCVAASTGSGKTLSYVIPMVEALKGKPIRLLRGLIVVPTRELVNQVRETVEMCIPNTGIKVGIAVGNKTIAEDRAQLLERRLQFDMKAFKRSQQKRTKPTIEDLMDWDSDSEDEYDVPYGHVAALRSAVDILICTPGRLVDHVRSTKGFHLHDVQWLVIDEADKLLDQSFQQWVDTIVPQLRRLPPMDEIEKKKRAFLHLPQRRFVQKVILSATMTRDISKLLSLDLKNPKLVLLEGQNIGGETEADTVTFELPPSLRETAVTLGRDHEKPIVLFRLLEELLAVPKTNKMDIDTSSSGTSSSDDDSVVEISSDDSFASSSAELQTLDSTSSSGVSDESDASLNSSSSSDFETSTGNDPKHSIHSKRSTSKNTGVRHQSMNGVLIFTNTNESAQRLSHLLTLLQPSWLSKADSLSQKVAALTKSTTSSSSRKLLSAFRAGRLPVLIASDRAARGLDVADLGLVVNYDVPSGVASYVHRVGRTARAGRAGHAYTIVAYHEARWFWKEIGRGGQIKRAQGKVLRREGLGKDVSENLMRRYEAALKKLGEEAKGN